MNRFKLVVLLAVVAFVIPDDDTNKDFYGARLSSRDILLEGQAHTKRRSGVSQTLQKFAAEPVR